MCWPLRLMSNLTTCFQIDKNVLNQYNAVFFGFLQQNNPKVLWCLIINNQQTLNSNLAETQVTIYARFLTFELDNLVNRILASKVICLFIFCSSQNRPSISNQKHGYAKAAVREARIMMTTRMGFVRGRHQNSNYQFFWTSPMFYHPQKHFYFSLSILIKKKKV